MKDEERGLATGGDGTSGQAKEKKRSSKVRRLQQDWVSAKALTGQQESWYIFIR